MDQHLKRIISLLLVFAMMSSNIPVSAFATDAEEEVCQHQYGEHVTVIEASCKEVGEEIATCLIEGCNATTSREIPILEHIFSDGACVNCGKLENAADNMQGQNPDPTNMTAAFYEEEEETEETTEESEELQEPALPTAVIEKVEEDNYSIAVNVNADDLTKEQLHFFGNWNVDLVLEVNKTITFNADEKLSIHHEGWNSDWIDVPFADKIVAADKPMHILRESAEALEYSNSLFCEDLFTNNQVVEFGFSFTEEFLDLNADFEAILELRIYEPDNAENYRVIGEAFEFAAVDVSPINNNDGDDKEGGENENKETEPVTDPTEDTVDNSLENDDSDTEEQGNDIPELPTATATEIQYDNLLFALNFKADDLTDEQLEYYGSWHADFAITLNKNVTFNEDAELWGQYDSWSAEWIKIPFKNVTVAAGEPFRIMENGGKLIGESGNLTYNDVYTSVKDFNCGIRFADEFMSQNPDLQITLELRLYNPETGEYHVIGEDHAFTTAVARNMRTYGAYDNITDALSEARENDTIVLIQDTYERRITVPNKVALDLYGHTLEAVYVSCFGNIVDLSQSNLGCLKISDSRFMIQADNEQLPVRVGDGYRFVEILKFNTAILDNGQKFAFQPIFEPHAHELLLQGADVSGVTINARVSWKNGNEELMQNFQYKDDLVGRYLNSYNNETGAYGLMFTLTLKDIEELEDLSFSVAVVAEIGAEVESISSTTRLEPINKFQVINTAKEYAPGSVIKVGDLFVGIQNIKPTIDKANVRVTVTPVKESDTVSGEFNANLTDWRNGTVTFNGIGEVTVTITDDYYCIPTSFNVIIKPKDVQKFIGLEGVNATLGEPVTLGQLFARVEGQTVDSSLVDIAVFDEVGNDISDKIVFTLDENDWTQATLAVNTSGNVVVRITEDPYTFAEETTISVYEHKFCQAESPATSMDVGDTVLLGELFANVSGAAIDNDKVDVTVTDREGNLLSGKYEYTADSSDWKASALKINTAGLVVVTVSEGAFTYNEAIDLTVMEYKFQAAEKPITAVSAGTVITLDQLFAGMENAEIDSASLKVVVSGADYKYTPNAENWEIATLEIFTGGKFDVTISENDTTYSKTVELTVIGHKFTTAADVISEVDAGEKISLGQLFEALPGAVIDSSKVSATVSGSDYSFTPDADNWENATLVIKTGGNVTVAISEDTYTYEERTDLRVSEYKFQKADNAVTKIDAGQVVTLGELFAGIDGTEIADTLVKVSVKNSAGNSLTGKYSFTAKASDWMTSTLVIHTGGVITVTIAENEFTYPESIVLDVTANKFTALHTTPVVIDANESITLGELFDEIDGAYIDSSKVNITVTGTNNSALTGKYTFVQDVEAWKNSSLTLDIGINATIVICEDSYTYPVTASLKVMERKFQPAENPVTQIGKDVPIQLGQLFAGVPGAQITSKDVEIAVEDSSFVYVPNDTDWTEAALQLSDGGSAKITISENDCTFTETVTLSVIEEKFIPKDNVPIKTANTEITLGELFDAAMNVAIADEEVKVSVTDEFGTVLSGKYSFAANADDWTQAKLTIKTGGKIRVTIKENQFTYEATAELTVKENKFAVVSPVLKTVDAGTPIKLERLFGNIVGAQIDSAEVHITVDGADYEYYPNENWREATVVIKNGGKVTVIIGENDYTFERELSLTVMEHKFQSAENALAHMNVGDSFALNQLFALREGAVISGELKITVTNEDAQILDELSVNAENWKDTELQVDTSGTVTVTIRESEYTHPYSATLTVMADKFALLENHRAMMKAGQTVTMGELFQALDSSSYAGNQIDVTITDEAGNTLAAEYVLDAEVEDWTDISLMIKTGTKVKVAIKEKENTYCNPVDVTLTVMEDKFKAKAVKEIDIGRYTLGDLFESVEGVVISAGQVNVAISGIETGAYERHNSDWTKGTITIPEGGKVFISISENAYTYPVTIELKVMEHKFETREDAPSSIDAGTITLGTLFEATSNRITNSKVNVSVAGVESASFELNTTDWTASTLTLTSGGTAKITITEDDYTHAVEITLDVIEEKFVSGTGVDSVDVNETLLLGDLFAENEDATVVSAKVTVTVTDGEVQLTEGEDYTLTRPDGAAWTQYILRFKKPGSMTVTISEEYTHTKDAVVTVMADKFTAKENIDTQIAYDAIPFDTLFVNDAGVTNLSITITYPDRTTETTTAVWNGGTVTLTKGGKVKIAIKDAADIYCNSTTAWVDVIENKFAEKTDSRTTANADEMFTLGELFQAGASGSRIDLSKLQVTLISGSEVLKENEDYILDRTGTDWKSFGLTIEEGGNITVVIFEEDNSYCNSISAALAVSERKFQAKQADPIYTTDSVTLGELFEIYGDARVNMSNGITLTVKAGNATLKENEDYFLTTADIWSDYSLAFVHGSDITVTITEAGNVNCLSETASLKIMQDKFQPKQVTDQAANTKIYLGDLFLASETALINSQNVTVTVEGAGTSYKIVRNDSDWTQSNLVFYIGAEVKVTIVENDGCTDAKDITFTVIADKFKPVFAELEIKAGRTLTMGELFQPVTADLPINSANVKVSVDVADGYTLEEDKDNWQNTKLAVSKGAEVTVSITDDVYTTTRSVTFDVMEDKFTTKSAEDQTMGVGFSLDKLFADGTDVTDVTVTIQDLISGLDYVFTADADEWSKGTLIINKVGNYTVKLVETDNRHCVPATANVVVKEDKFAKTEETVVKTTVDNIPLSELFTAMTDVTLDQLDITVFDAQQTAMIPDQDYKVVVGATWDDSAIRIHHRGNFTVTISDGEYTFEEMRSLTVNQHKFQALDVTKQYTNTPIRLDTLFDAIENVGEEIVLTVSGVEENEYTLNDDTSDWTAQTVTFTEGGSIQITIRDTDFCAETKSVVFTVWERPFAAKDDIQAQDAGEIALSELFTGADQSMTALVSVDNGDFAEVTLPGGNVDIAVGGWHSVTIKEKDEVYCEPATASVKVMENRFEVVEDHDESMHAGAIRLGDLFVSVGDASIAAEDVSVTVMDLNGNALTGNYSYAVTSENWQDIILTIDTDQEVRIEITDGVYTNKVSTTIKVIQEKFLSIDDKQEKTADVAIKLGDLFSEIDGVTVTDTQVTVTVTALNGDVLPQGTFTLDETGTWENRVLKFTVGCDALVTISETQFAQTADIELTVMEHKFDIADQATSKIAENVEITLGDLFKPVDTDANISDADVAVTVWDGDKELIAGTDYTYTADQNNWMNGKLRFIAFGSFNVVVSETEHTYDKGWDLTVTEDKFGPVNNAKTVVGVGTITTLGEIFTNAYGTEIDSSKVNVVVKGADGNDLSDGVYDFELNSTDWAQSTLVINQIGNFKVIISEDALSSTEEWPLTVKMHKFTALTLQNAYQTPGLSFSLENLFGLLEGCEVDSAKVQLQVAGADYTYTDDAANWNDRVLSITSGGDVTVTIFEDELTFAEATVITVNEKKFEAKIPAVQTVGEPIALKDLFTDITEKVTTVTVYVTGESGTATYENLAWPAGTIQIDEGGIYTIEICEQNNIHCLSQYVEVTVKENKFTEQENILTKRADEKILLGELFAALDGAEIDDSKVTVYASVTDATGAVHTDKYLFNAESMDTWENYELTITEGGLATAVIYEEDAYAYSAKATFTVEEQKFVGIAEKSVDTGAAIVLGDLFNVCEGATVEDSANVTVTVADAKGNVLVEQTSENGWKSHELTFTDGADVTVTIQEAGNQYCLKETVSLKVMQDKFDDADVSAGKRAGAEILLGELFTAKGTPKINSTKVLVTVELPESDYDYIQNTTDWTRSKLIIYTVGNITVKIIEDDGCTYDESVTFTVTADKFDPSENAPASVDAGEILTMSDLFRQASEKLGIDSDAVDIAVTGIDASTYVLTENADWRESSLQVNTGARVKVGIRDSEYTDWEYVSFDVIAAKFADKTEPTTSTNVETVVKLGELFEATGNAPVTSSKVGITVMNGTVELAEGETTYILTKPEDAQWQDYELTFHTVGDMTVIISEEYSETEDATLLVKEDKFRQKANVINELAAQMPHTVKLGDYFELIDSNDAVEEVYVTVTGQNGQAYAGWQNVNIAITSGGIYTVTIRESNRFCNEASVTLTVTEDNFTAKSGPFVYSVDDAISLSDLFDIRTENVSVTVTDIAGTSDQKNLNKDDSLFGLAAGKYTVKIEAAGTTYSNSAEVDLTIRESKFVAVTPVESQTAGTAFDLTKLVEQTSGSDMKVVSVAKNGTILSDGYSFDATENRLAINEAGIYTVTITAVDASNQVDELCIPIPVEVTVKATKFAGKSVARDAATGNKVTVKLSELFASTNFAVTAQVTATVVGSSTSVNAAASAWADAELTFETTGGIYTIRIEEAGGLTNAAEASLIVNAHKFTPKTPVSKVYTTSTVTLGDLFAEVNGATVVDQNVEVTVYTTRDGSTVNDVCTVNYNTTNWEQGTLTFTSGCDVSVTITDKNYCVASETVSFKVWEKKFDVASDIPNQTAGYALNLGQIFTKPEDVSTVTVTVDQGTPQVTTWDAGVTVAQGGLYSITITETGNNYCESVMANNVKVMENVFIPKRSEAFQLAADTGYSLDTFFALDDRFVSADETLEVTVSGINDQVNGSYTWPGSISISTGGEYTLTVKKNSDYCYPASVKLMVIEDNFQVVGNGKLIVKQNEEVKLLDLFTFDKDLAVVVTGGTVTNGIIDTSTPGKYTVTITREGTTYSDTESATLIVQEQKLSAVAGINDQTVGTPFALSTLVTGADNLAVVSIAENGTELTDYTVENGNLAINKVGTFEVTVTELGEDDIVNELCAPITVSVTVMADKFIDKRLGTINIAEDQQKTKVKLSDLFAQVGGAEIIDDVVVTVTNTDTNQDVTNSVYTATEASWLNRTLTLASGKYSIQITDGDEFTRPVVTMLQVNAYKFGDASNNDLQFAGKPIELTDLFTAKTGATIDETNITVTLKSGETTLVEGTDYKLVKDASWTEYSLTLSSGFDGTVTITDGNCCLPTVVELVVLEERFAVANSPITEAISDQAIVLNKLFKTGTFANNIALVNVAVTVTSTDGSEIPSTLTQKGTSWLNYELAINGSGELMVTITEKDTTISNSATVPLTIKAEKFKATSKTEWTANAAIPLSQLFEATGTPTGTVSVDVTTKDVSGNHVSYQQTYDGDWTSRTLTFDAGCSATVTIKDEDAYGIGATITLKVLSEKFTVKQDVGVLTAGEDISLSKLFDNKNNVETVKFAVNGGDASETTWGGAQVNLNGGQYTITITDPSDQYCKQTSATVTVYEEKFAVKQEIEEKITTTAIPLGDLFEEGSAYGKNIVKDDIVVTVDGVEVDVDDHADNWTAFTISIPTTGKHKVAITDNDFCAEAEVNVTVNEVKFTAKSETVNIATSCGDADGHENHKVLTLGELFNSVDGATIEATKLNVQVKNGDALLTSGTDYVFARDTADWSKSKLWFNETDDAIGTLTVIINDTVFCVDAEQSVKVIEPVEDAIKVKFENYKQYLYRVGNVNAITLSSIFEENTELAEGVKIGTVTVEIVAVEGMGNVSITNTPNETNWTQGTVKFSGTGVVTIRVCDDRIAKPITMNLEVVDAYNVIQYSELSRNNSNVNTVLLDDIEISSGGQIELKNATLYGNGFTFDCTNGRTIGTNAAANYLVRLNKAKLDNVKIVGKVYTSYGANSDSDYNDALIISGTDGNVITNCYLSNTASPIRVEKGSILITNTTLKGGNFANMDIRGGNITLDNVTTINQSSSNDKSEDGTTVVGLGIVVNNVASVATVNVGTIKQYNYLSQNDKQYIMDSSAQSLFDEMFKCKDTNGNTIVFTENGTKWVNTGILSMSTSIGNDNISDIEGYVHAKPSFVGVTGYLHCPAPNVTEVEKPYEPNAQDAITPSAAFDFTTKNYLEKTEDSNDFCYAVDGVVMVSMDAGDKFAWDPMILNVTKNGNALDYAVSMNGEDYTSKIVYFDTAGKYNLTYSYTDRYNYTINNNSVVNYEKEYTQNLTVNVSVVQAEAKPAKFTFYGYSKISTSAATTMTETKTITTASGKTYIMPADTYTSNVVTTTIEEDNKEKITVKCPVVYVDFKDNTSDFNWLYPLFLGVKIEDYADGGTATSPSTIVEPKSQSKPDNLTVITGESEWSAGAGSGGGTGSAKKIPSGTYKNLYGYVSAALGSDKSQSYTYGRFSYQDNMGNLYYYVIAFYKAAHKCPSVCVTPDTLVTLADGTQKRIDEVTHQDKLLVWDFYSGEYAVVPSAIIFDHGYGNNTVIELKFSDDTVVKAVNLHQFLDTDLNTWVSIAADNVHQYVGHSFAKRDGNSYKTVELVDYTVSEQYIEAYGIISACHYNILVEDMFSTDFMPEDYNVFNYFELGEDMKYDSEKMQSDIETYGLYTYEEFADYLTYEQFVAFNVQYMKIAVGKGMYTHEGILDLIATYLKN